jgi:hypothetical protein
MIAALFSADICGSANLVVVPAVPELVEVVAAVVAVVPLFEEVVAVVEDESAKTVLVQDMVIKAANSNGFRRTGILRGWLAIGGLCLTRTD